MRRLLRRDEGEKVGCELKRQKESSRSGWVEEERGRGKEQGLGRETRQRNRYNSSCSTLW